MESSYPYSVPPLPGRARLADMILWYATPDLRRPPLLGVTGGGLCLAASRTAASHHRRSAEPRRAQNTTKENRLSLDRSTSGNREIKHRAD